MPTSQHITEFAGLPVMQFTGWNAVHNDFSIALAWARNRGEPHSDLPPSYEALFRAVAVPSAFAWRLRDLAPIHTFHDGATQVSPRAEEFPAYMLRFAQTVRASDVRALIMGYVFDDSDDEHGFAAVRAREQLVELAPRWPNLRALFFGEVLQEECEISWIENTDLTPLLAAFPDLTEFTVRGANGLGLAVGRHENLRRLSVQSGGLPGALARQIVAADLPALEHLELWLGDEEYGCDTTPDDLAPVLSGEAFPGLRSLGLRNAQDIGVWVKAVTEAPVVSRLHTLDLSLGTLTDEHAEILLAAPALRGLQRLDLHHHFLSEEMAERVRAEFTAAGVETDVCDPQEPDVDGYGDEVVLDYYAAVSE
jgi:hypothetical protein